MAIPDINGEQDAQDAKTPKGSVHRPIARRLMRKHDRVHEHSHSHSEHHDGDGDKYAELQLAMLEIVRLDSAGNLHQ
jgi:hypothetical protein